MARKVFVQVIACFDGEGNIRPLKIQFDNDEVYSIDRVRNVCRAAATKVGGTGMRYTIVICGQETYIFLDENRWFVEAKQ